MELVLRITVGTRWSWPKREAICTVNGRTIGAHPPKPVGVQRLPPQALEAGHGDSGFDIASMEFGLALVSYLYLFLPLGMGIFALSLYFGTM